MLLFGSLAGELEVRRERDGAARVAGFFPYRRRAVLSDGAGRGQRREEVFASRAFAARVEDPRADLHLLVGHDFDRPLASRAAGTLELREDDDAVSFEARISPEVAETTHGRDALALLRARLATGLSPGFRVSAGGEEVTEESGALLRTIRRAELWELSIVTRPAYSEAQVEARNWAPGNRANTKLPDFLRRWRP